MTHLTYNRGVLDHSVRCPHTKAELRPLFCNSCTADEVYARYLECKRSYYIDGISLADDENFDRFEKYCQDRYPLDTRFYMVGYNPSV